MKKLLTYKEYLKEKDKNDIWCFFCQGKMPCKVHKRLDRPTNKKPSKPKSIVLGWTIVNDTLVPVTPCKHENGRIEINNKWWCIDCKKSILT